MCTTEKSPSKMANTITNVIRNVVSKQRKRYVANGYDLDLSYICDNIIAMGYPAANIEKWYRNHIDDVVKFLEENHKDHYKIYNLCSERNYDISTFHGRVAVFPFADHNPPTIELMQKFCDDINSWLKGDERNVAAVHCKAGKGRTGTMICCYLLQCGFARTADEALSYYDEKRTKDKKGVTIPSQRRYVEYYAKLLTSGKPYERRTLQICEIRFSSPPLSSSQGTVLSLSTLDDPSCPDKVKTLQNFAIDFRKTSNVEITDRCIPVTGDVRIELSHKVTKKTMLHLWFNVYFIDEEGERHGHGDDTKIIYEFKKNEIDDAHKDKENKTFAEDFSVQLVFQTIPSRNSYVNACGDKTDNLVMNTSVHSNYDHNNHCGNIYNNSALSGGNYIVDNVSTGHHSQMDIQPVIEPLKQQNHNNSSNSINNTNLAIRQQQHQRQQQQEQYAFPTNQNQYKQQQNRNMNSVGPMNINSITSSPPAPGTQNSSNNSTISVKNKNLSLKLSSSLVISPQKQQQQQQRTQQEQQSQLSQTLHEKQQQILHHQQQQNSKNNLKHPGKLSKQQLQQQYLEQPSSNKSMAISSNQQHLQQQHESRTNSTSSNTSKSSSNSSSSISISSAASSSACIGEDWESGEFKVNTNNSTSSADVILFNCSQVTSNIKRKFNNKINKNALNENNDLNSLNISDNNISKKCVNIQHDSLKKDSNESLNQITITPMMAECSGSLDNIHNEESGIMIHKISNDNYCSNIRNHETIESNVKNLNYMEPSSTSIQRSNDYSYASPETMFTSTSSILPNLKNTDKIFTSSIVSNDNYLLNSSNFSKLNFKNKSNNSNNFKIISRTTNDDGSELCSRRSSSSNVISDSANSNIFSFKQDINLMQNKEKKKETAENIRNVEEIKKNEILLENINSIHKSNTTEKNSKTCKIQNEPCIGTISTSNVEGDLFLKPNSLKSTSVFIPSAPTLSKSYCSSQSLVSTGGVAGKLPFDKNPQKRNKLKIWLQSFHLKKDPEFSKNFKFSSFRNHFKKPRKNSKRALFRHSSKTSNIYKISNESLVSDNYLNDFVVVEDIKSINKNSLLLKKEATKSNSSKNLLVTVTDTNLNKVEGKSQNQDVLLKNLLHTSFSENLECEPESENLENKEISVSDKNDDEEKCCNEKCDLKNDNEILNVDHQIQVNCGNVNNIKMKRGSSNSCNQLAKSVESVDFYSSLCDRQLSFGTSPISKSPQSFVGSYGTASGIGTSPASISHLKLIDENPLEDEIIKTPTIVAKPINTSSIGFFTFESDEGKKIYKSDNNANEVEKDNNERTKSNIKTPQNISNKILEEIQSEQNSTINYPSVINLRNYFENESKISSLGRTERSPSIDELDAKMFFDPTNQSDYKPKKCNQNVLQVQALSSSPFQTTSTPSQQSSENPFNFGHMKKCLNDISDMRLNSSSMNNSSNTSTTSATTSTTNIFKRGSIP
ncbi:putative uncharacterized protein DDB_G0277255 isoform X1 [Condylostylus longicornis]|uniref:putative uncharacterized protein DDB_G0277255 isoform X1 n=1 Tax=Condylostylus longicornis TaxID=2530218 RepID=UPI00244E4520|nr:putative uncharacterized protein DDB_G0277255 isoform X1 [Condylostylus longicornis]